MKAIIVTDQGAGTVGMKLAERPEPQPDPLPRLPSWQFSPRSFVSLLEMIQRWNACSTSHATGHG